jgi:hypothetical protein
MRSLMLGACLLAVAVVGFHSMISSALVAARDAKAATFSERFAPALKTPSGRGLAMSEGGGGSGLLRHYNRRPGLRRLELFSPRIIVVLTIEIIRLCLLIAASQQPADSD